MASATEPRGLSDTAQRSRSDDAGVAGAAVLVAGSRLGSAAFEHAASTFTSMRETLLASHEPWLVRRLSPTAGEWLAPTRAAIKHHVGELASRCDDDGALLIVVAGAIVAVEGAPALVTGAHHDADAAGTTLPLTAVRELVLSCGVATAVIALAGVPVDADAGDAARWAAALATGRSSDVVIAGGAGAGGALLEALGRALAGDAVDSGTGTVTSSSIADYLRREAPAACVLSAGAARTVVRPLTGELAEALWGPRRRRRLAIDSDDLSGSTLPGELRLERVVSSGGFGTVYRATDLGLGRAVAVKILRRAHDPDSDDAWLFRQEVRAVAQLRHRNVVYVHHADTTVDGRLFLEMELLDGATLQQLVAREGPLPRPRAIELTCQLLAGLSAAHAAGIIHADVKPSNVVVVDDGGRERAVLVDFGLARLRPADGPAESAGGTRAYMAPEQLREQRVDARSDVYAAALVMVRLLTGWQRAPGGPLSPPLDDLDDPALRAALGRALAEAPADRFASADELAAALAGGALPSPSPPSPPPPFRHLAPFTERDRGRLHGRDADVVTLVRALEASGVVVFTAPSGTGKTSMLRAGLVPYFEALGTRALYWPCDDGAPAALAAAIAPGLDDVGAAIERWHVESHGRRLVLVLDQVERLLGSAGDGAAILDVLLAIERRAPDGAIAVVLAVREDFLARLLAASPRLSRGVQQVRLPPLDRAQARVAIERPLAEHRLTIEPELLDELLADLSRAGAQVGAELGWQASAAVYPPHLQLACSVLYGALGPVEAQLTREHYRRLGGFVAIVGEHLQRVLDAMTAADREIARELFLTLITSARTRAVRAEGELVELLARFPAAQVTGVLESLRERGLLVPLRGRGGERVWELVHDSLVKTIEGWLASHDLDRRRAADVVRFHLRQSETAASLLSANELRDVERHAGLVDELEQEWARRPASGWTPALLVERSRRAARRRRRVVIGTGAAVAIVTGLLLFNWYRERARRLFVASQRDRDLGRIRLALQPFDWDAERLARTDVAAALLPELAWELREPDPDDPGAPGPLIDPSLLHVGARSRGQALVQDVEVRGGDAILVVSGRAQVGAGAAGGAPCEPSIIPLHRLPGFAKREHVVDVPVRVPTCAATRAGMLEIPAGDFIRGGPGDPPPSYPADQLPPEEVRSLPTFWIDRTEVTNAQFALLRDQYEVTGLLASDYPDELAYAAGATYPRGDLDFHEARAFCRFLGKDLPSSDQWTKALRGGLVIDGAPNPMPRRNFPWGAPIDPPPAAINEGPGIPHPSPVAVHPRDRSPYGLFDLAGASQEWTRSIATARDFSRPAVLRHHVTRGGNWSDATPAILLDMMASENPRPARRATYEIGARCASPSGLDTDP